MSSLPVVRQVKWSAILPQSLILIAIWAAFFLFGVEDAIIKGTLLYLVISLSLRSLVPRHHRKGIQLYKKSQFKAAIPYFEQSYDFFSKNAWIDEWRSFVLLSASEASYREMALVNIAFCHSQSGSGAAAKEVYIRTINEFPDSKLAKSALTFIESLETV